MKTSGYYEKDVAKKVATVLNEMHSIGTFSAQFDPIECMKMIRTICPVFDELPQDQSNKLMLCLMSAHQTGWNVGK